MEFSRVCDTMSGGGETGSGNSGWYFFLISCLDWVVLVTILLF